MDALVPLYALGALDGDDLARFTEELKASESLRAMVHEYREAATSLALSLEPVAPSPEIKSRLLDRIAAPAQRSAPIFTRVFWTVAALFLIGILVRSLLFPVHPQSMPLRGEMPAPLATGSIAWRGRSVELAVSGLPALPEGKVYQLWHLGPGPKPVPEATFTVNASGQLRGWGTLKNAIAKGDKFAITVEPEGGSLSPTMPLYVVPGQ